MHDLGVIGQLPDEKQAAALVGFGVGNLVDRLPLEAVAVVGHLDDDAVALVEGGQANGPFAPLP